MQSKKTMTFQTRLFITFLGAVCIALFQSQKPELEPHEKLINAKHLVQTTSETPEAAKNLSANS